MWYIVERVAECVLPVSSLRAAENSHITGGSVPHVDVLLFTMSYIVINSPLCRRAWFMRKQEVSKQRASNASKGVCCQVGALCRVSLRGIVPCVWHSKKCNK